MNNQNEMALKKRIKQYEKAFIQLIHDRFGIIIQNQSDTLNKIIFDACTRFDCNPESYLALLKKSSPLSPVLEHLVAGVTIQETYFFRDKNQNQLIQEILLPELITKKIKENNLHLRIWSAGCASGEEIYTVAIQLAELLPDIKQWFFHLLATDINTNALQKASKGHYAEWSMRSTSDYYKKKYFHKVNNKYVIDESIRKMVNFEYLNLVDDSYPSIFTDTNAQDLIFCRNVLIYFDKTHIENLMKKLSLSLSPGGYLLLGASDPVCIQETTLVFEIDKGIVFKNPEIHEITNNKTAEKVRPSFGTDIIDKPGQAMLTDKIQAKKINQLLDEGKWNAMLDLELEAEKKGLLSPLMLNAKAMALANLGQLKEAAAVAKKSLTLDVTNQDTYFILALILIELNQLEEAEIAFRKVIFLDHQFVAGHFQLGLLLLKNKRRELGLKSLRNALIIAQTKDPTLPVAGFRGLYYGRLAEILKKEIDIYSF